MSKFGEELRRIRLERGMSQEDLATLLGTSKQVISRYETGQRSPKISVASEYAEKLGVPLSALEGVAPAPIYPNFVADRLREAMRIRSLNQTDLVLRTGIGKSSISTYLTGSYLPKQTNLYKLAKALSVNPAWLMGEAVPMDDLSTLITQSPNLSPITNTYPLPLLGKVAAGSPIRTNPEDEDMIHLPFDPGKANATLRVQGDSMIPRYLDGDIVLIRYQDDVDDGQIAAVCIDDDVTLKKVYHIPNGVYLVSENPAHPPMTFTLDEVNNIHIVGLAIGFLRWEH